MFRTIGNTSVSGISGQPQMSLRQVLQTQEEYRLAEFDRKKAQQKKKEKDEQTMKQFIEMRPMLMAEEAKKRFNKDDILKSMCNSAKKGDRYCYIAFSAEGFNKWDMENYKACDMMFGMWLAENGQEFENIRYNVTCGLLGFGGWIRGDLFISIDMSDLQPPVKQSAQTPSYTVSNSKLHGTPRGAYNIINNGCQLYNKRTND